MEPLRGNLGSEIPGLLAELATRQVMTHLSLLPVAGLGGGSRARRFNQDAAFQIAAGIQKMFFTRPAISDGMGGIDSGITYSLHALLLADDLTGMLRCLWNGVTVDDEHLALGLTHSVRPKGNYLGQKHTAVHCQENYWDSRYFGAKFPRSKPVREHSIRDAGCCVGFSFPRAAPSTAPPQLPGLENDRLHPRLRLAVT